VFHLLAFSRNEQLVANTDPVTQLNILEDLNLHKRFHCLGLFVKWKMLKKLCPQCYCKTDFFCGISDSIREGSGVSAVDELLNKHTFCYSVIEESVLPKFF
jgi:hypothetical protein